MDKPDTFGKAALLADEGRHQLGGIDPAPGHGIEMTAAEGQVLVDQLIGIVDDPHRADGVGSQLGTNQQRLGIGIADTADHRGALHFFENMLKLGSEGGVFDVMDLPLQAFLGIPGRHTAAAGAQVGMVIHAEEHIHHTIQLGCDSKKSSHEVTPLD